jgi:hypothetical protein
VSIVTVPDSESCNHIGNGVKYHQRNQTGASDDQVIRWRGLIEETNNDPMHSRKIFLKCQYHAALLWTVCFDEILTYLSFHNYDIGVTTALFLNLRINIKTTRLDPKRLSC